MTEAVVRVERDQALTTIVLNRPRKLNALSGELLRALAQALAEAEADEGCRCVLLTGAGRGFSAGADLTDLDMQPAPGQSLDLGATLHETYHPVLHRIRAMPKPVVAAINGIAAGAGCNIGLAADVVVAARSARFIQAFIKIGLAPDAGGSWIIPRLIGRGRALQWMMSGEALDAQTALDWGLVSAVYDDESFADEAGALARRMAAQPTAALAAIKQLLDASSENDFPAQLDLEASLQSRLGRSQDAVEGISAFIQKREPAFQGR